MYRVDGRNGMDIYFIILAGGASSHVNSYVPFGSSFEIERPPGTVDRTGR